MALENRTAVGAAAGDSRLSHGMGGDVKGWSRTIEATAAANANSTYIMGYIPSNARILGLSKLSFDDLASTGSPTIDIGLAPVDGNITEDPDALNDGIDVATAAGTAQVIKDIANYGKEAWRFVSGQTTDPKGQLQVKVSILDAAVNTGGTITLELLFLVP
jgi:hypothetical protein